MDAELAAEITVGIIYIIVGLGLSVLSGFFIYWQAKYLNTVPEQLKRIAEALEKIAQK